MKRIFLLASLVAMTSLPGDAQFLGQTPATPQSAAPPNQALLDALLHAARPELLFHPDDVLSVQIYGIKDYAVEQQVAGDGSILFPLIGKIHVSGLTVEQLEVELAKQLAQGGMVHDPQVTVTAVSRPSAIVTVAGDVAKPGTFPAYGNRTLLDYLSEAGGLNNSVLGNSPVNSPASSTVTIIRPSLAQAVSIPLGSDAANSTYGNIPLFPGDQVRVGTVGVVYAIGAFKTQGAYPLKNASPTTLLQLAAIAGGIGYEADKKDAHIIRTAGDRRYIVDINVAKVLKGEAADVMLHADDILIVPTNQMKASIKGGGPGVIVSLAAAYLYAHP